MLRTRRLWRRDGSLVIGATGVVDNEATLSNANQAIENGGKLRNWDTGTINNTATISNTGIFCNEGTVNDMGTITGNPVGIQCVPEPAAVASALAAIATVGMLSRRRRESMLSQAGSA